MDGTVVLAMVPFVTAVAVLFAAARYIGKAAILPSVITGLVSFVIIQSFVASAISLAVPYPNMVLVAASNSSAQDKARADYVVTGSADDELAAAVAYASTNSMAGVHSFAGTYTINTSVSIASGLIFEGAGAGTVFTPGAVINVGMLRVLNNDNVTIRLLSVQGNAARQAMYGIQATNADNVLLEDITGTGLWNDDCISLDMGVTNSTARRLTLSGNTAEPGEVNSLMEVDSGAHHVTVEDSTFTGGTILAPAGNGLGLHTHTGEGQTHDVTIRNNSFTGTFTNAQLRITGDVYVPGTEPTYNVAVNNNTFTGTCVAGLWNIGDTEDVTYTGNSVVSTTSTIGIGWRASANVTRLTFTNNTFFVPVLEELVFMAEPTTVFTDVAFVGGTYTRVVYDPDVTAAIAAGDITGLP